MALNQNNEYFFGYYADMVVVMKTVKELYLLFIKVFTAKILPWTILLLVAGCNYPPQALPIINKGQQDIVTGRLGRVDVPAEDLEIGLIQIFQRLEQQVGNFDYQPIIQDYVPLIRKSLYDSGFCGIRRLNLNNAVVDIDFSFRVDHSPATLNIEVFINGQTQPAFTLVNKYRVISQ